MNFILETKNLTKTFGAFVANDKISLKIRANSIHAIVGENGAGKSTLLKSLFGLHKPSSGEIYLRGEKVQWKTPLEAIARGLGMVQQHFMLVESLSAIDNIILGAEPITRWGRIDRNKAIRELEARLPSQHLRVPWEKKVEELSVGVRQRIEILKVLYRDAEILFLDEPTAVLTPQEIEDFFEVLRALRTQGKTIVIITHKLKEVLALCDDYTVLRQGRVTGAGRVGETSYDQLVELMIGERLLTLDKHIFAVAEGEILKCAGVSEKKLSHGSLRDISLRLQAREIVGVAGVDGSGQKNLVEVLMGLRPYEGSATLFSQSLKGQSTRSLREQAVGLVPEDRLSEGLWGEESCYNNMIIGLEQEFTCFEFLNYKKIRELTSEWAEQFDVRASSLENSVSSLSGGNQQKLIFAREVGGRKPRFLICHQPTRGVDIAAIQLIYKYLFELRKQGVGILLISSDLDELTTLADRIYVLFEGQILAEFQENEFDACQIGQAMLGRKQERASSGEGRPNE